MKCEENIRKDLYANIILSGGNTLFEGFKPEYHFAEDTDFTECINEFVAAKSIDLIITIPKKHGLIDSLFKRSHTKMLAFHSHVPLLVIHD